MLHRWQERVLLRPVEAVNFVAEQDRTPPHSLAVFSFAEDLPDPRAHLPTPR